jgi:IPT/TIG domain
MLIRLGSLRGRFRAAMGIASVVFIVLGVGTVVTARPASASTAPLITNGNAAYTTGTTSPPNQFNVLSLVTGGASAVNPSSLTVVSQPASGAATVSTTTTSGLITYTPAKTTTGVQTLTFAYCAPGDTYPSAGNCTTATMTYRPTTGQWFGDEVEGTNVVEEIETAVSTPSTVLHGSTLSMSVAPAASSIPASEDGLTVEDGGQFSLILPVPSGLTYVPGSVNVTGGDAITSGKVAATYCTAPVSDACSAHINSGDYKTTYPYLETFLNPDTTVPGGDNVTMPTLTAQFTASGSAGTVVPVDFTEFVVTTTVQAVGAVTFDGYPSCASCGSSNSPAYTPPVPQATTTIAPPPTVTGVAPDSGTPAGGTSVVISGEDLGDASAVNFGTIPGTITADSSSSVTATSPAGTGTGTVDVTVTTPDGTSATSSSDHFTYVLTTPPPSLSGVSPNEGPTAGGTDVTVSGDNLGSASAVNFGPGNPGTITADSATSVTATSPPGTGTVDVTVTTPSGTTVPSEPDQFTYGTPVLSKLSSWTDTAACGVQASTSVAPASIRSATLTVSGGNGGGGGAANSSTDGGGGGAASSVTSTVPLAAGQRLTAVTGCAGSTAPSGSGVVSAGGAGGSGFSDGGSGGSGYYCLGANLSGDCVGEGGADGSGGGGGGSSAVCLGSSCQSGNTPVAVAAGGGGGGESMCSGSAGGAGGAGGSGSSTSSSDLTGAGPSGATGGTGAMSGNAGGSGGVNTSGDSPIGGSGAGGADTVSAGYAAGNGGGGGGYVGGAGSSADAAEDCASGGGGGAGSSWAVNSSGASFTTTSSSAAATVAFYGFVGTSPSVTAEPGAVVADAGQSATFTAAASGNPAPAVQWQLSTDGGKTFNNILGATSTTYAVTAESFENGDQYQAVFTNSVGTADTDPASLAVDSLPVVTTQPAGEIVNEGQQASFTAEANGTPGPTVQWQISTNGGTLFSDISGATSTTYSFTTAAGDNANQYRAAFANSVGTVDSSPGILTLRTLPTITTQPASTSVHERAVAHFTAAASSYPTPAVQWQVSTNGGTTFSNIARATSTTYSFTTSAAENHHRFRAVFTNPVGSTRSAPATLTVTAAVPVKVTTTSLHEGSVYKMTKSVYSATLRASGGISPYQWSLASGKLPAGLTLSSTGVISGKAGAARTSTFVVRVVDTKTTVTPQTSATKTLSITIVK